MGLMRLVRSRRGRASAFVLSGACALCAATASGAAAEEPTPLWTRCEGAVAGDLTCNKPTGVASAPASAPQGGDVYAVDQGNSRIVEYTPWGDPVGSFGETGSGKGQFAANSLQGIAIDSSGELYVADRRYHRVQKFDPEGSFVYMIGGEVNKTAVDEARPEAEQNLCPAPGHPADECQAGTTGTGAGQFAIQPRGSFVAIGGSDRLYVGDMGRIEVFNPDGSYREELSGGPLEGKAVQALASEKSGNLFVSFAENIFGELFEEEKGVLKLSGAGAQLCTAEVADPRALAADAAGNLYAVDGESVRKFKAVGCAGEMAEVEDGEFPFFPEGLEASSGIALGSACFAKPTKEDDLYLSNGLSNGHVSGHFFLRTFGPQPNRTAPSSCERPQRTPQILAQYALSAGERESVVRAQINPRFWLNTTYWVQYGTAACLGPAGAEDWSAPCVSERPVPPGAPLGGSGADEVVRTQGVFLGGLLPGTEYRYRFAAQSRTDAEGMEVNEHGGPVFGAGAGEGEEGSTGVFRTAAPLPAISDSCPNSELRSGPAARLPDCRAYEMVSPVDKDASNIRPGSKLLNSQPVARNQSSLTGDKLTYTAERRFGDAVSQPAAPQYIATRGLGGWSNHGISPPRGVLGGGGLYPDNEFKAFSADLCEGWLVSDPTTAPPLAPGGIEEGQNLYRRTNCGGEGYRTLGPNDSESMILEGTSADGEEAVFLRDNRLYAAGGEGEERAVCLLANGSAAPFGCAAGTALRSFRAYETNMLGALSADGSRLYWTATEQGPGPIYLRENPGAPESAGKDGEGNCVPEAGKGCTVAVSGAVPDGEEATFWAASADGARAIYRTGQLGNIGGGHSGDLYEFEAASGDSKLIAHKVWGLLGASADARRIYLVSDEVCGGENKEGRSPVEGQPNLYLYEAGESCGTGQFSFVATLAGADASANPFGGVRFATTRSRSATPPG